MFVLNVITAALRRIHLLPSVVPRSTARVPLVVVEDSPTSPTIYGFDPVLKTGNKVCEKVQLYLSPGFNLETVLRAIHTQTHQHITRTNQLNGNKIYKDIPSGHTLTVNNRWEIIDYSPK